jgi:hypothetical protein
LGLLDNVIRHTETDKLSILNVLGNLGVKTTSHSVIIGVLIRGSVRNENIDLPALPEKITMTACTLACWSDQKEFLIKGR